MIPGTVPPIALALAAIAILLVLLDQAPAWGAWLLFVVVLGMVLLGPLSQRLT